MPLFLSSLIHSEQMFLSVTVLRFPVCSVSLTCRSSAGALDFHKNTCCPVSPCTYNQAFHRRKTHALWDEQAETDADMVGGTQVCQVPLRTELDIGVRLLSIAAIQCNCCISSVWSDKLN